MEEIKITEVTFSYSEEQSAPPPEGSEDSTITSYIVAHAVYEYLGIQNTAECNIYKIAEKKYTKDQKSGLTVVTVTPSAEEFPDKDTILSKITEVITKKVNSDIAEEHYQFLIRSKLAEALTVKGLPTRMSPTGKEVMSDLLQ